MANGKRRVNLNKKILSVLKGLAVYALIAIAALIFFYQVSGGPANLGNEVPISQIINQIKEEKVEKISLEGDKIIAEVKTSDQKLISRKEAGESIYKILESSGVDPKSVTIEVKDLSMQQAWLGILSAILPILLLVGLMFFLFRNAREAGQGIFSFAQSRAKLFTKDQPQIKFSDVAGAEEAKRELSEVVDFLKNPKKYTEIGARIPKGVLLVGPAGVGKTLMARSVAGEAGVPFYSIAGSEFMEILVGVGASRVRDMFSQAKKNSPSIIFIDEIESIGRQRGIGISGGHDEREQTLNQILVEMDGFTPNERVTVIGASVTGDTPILIKDKNDTKLLPIEGFVDQYYNDKEEDIEKSVDNIETLGFDRKIPAQNTSRLYFQNSAFKKVRSVFRHKVKEIYEITYLGGKLRATGNHSVFIRTNQGIVPKKVSELKTGDILVNIPLKVNMTGSREFRELRFHKFNNDIFKLTLPVYQDTEEDQGWEQKYIFAQTNYTTLSQSQIGNQIGVSQTTVGNWLRGVFLPRAISRSYFNHQLPQKVEVTPRLCRLFGYYVAEGYARKGIDFCFNEKETNLVFDLKILMKNIFGLKPDRVRFITENAVNIIYYSKPIGDFFAKYCGKGARNKRVPSFLFEAPREYFIEFLKGELLGDGHIDKDGKGQITSISKQLILELNWLCRMHGIKSYIDSFTTKEGRVIKNGKPLHATPAYRLGFGKYNNPFIKFKGEKDNPIKRPIVQSVKKLPFDGFVYDLCGVENEAFFGGESPILLHNTNRPDLLDAALIRPGRFDRRVVLTLPDLEERKAIIVLHMKGKPFTKDVSVEKLARRTVGFSGADLANMLNEAAILAAREGKKAIDNKDLEEAATKEKLGPQRKRMQSKHDRELAAYHEAGHAIVGHFLKNVDPVHRISIVSRGLSGGHTLFPPTEDRSNESKSRLVDQITAALGGQAAEDMVFKDISTGAASDIEVATSIAKAMVTQYGMSSLGPLSVHPRPMFGIWKMEDGGEVSPKLHDAIDVEIRKIVDLCLKNAQSLLRKHKTKLDLVAKALLEKETLESDEFESIVGQKKKG